MNAMALALAAFLLCAATGMARAEKLIVALSSDHVAIDSNFTGAELTVFGAIERDAERPRRNGPYDVVMIVRGPLGAVTVRDKQRFGPFWLNREQHVFRSAPSFLTVLSDRPVSEIIGQEPRQRFSFSVDKQFAAQAPGADADFASALIRIRRAQGLFSDDSDAIIFLSSNLFRTTIRLPGSAALGHYQIDVAAFANEETVATLQTGFWVNRSGIEHILAAAAQDHGAIYGLAVIAMALSFGWIASVIFRRD